MTGFSSVFAGPNVNPAMLSYKALAFSANTTLQWNLPGAQDDSAETIAAKMDLTPAGAGLALRMPDATLVTVGQDVLFNNVGAHSVDILDSTGASLLTITAGTSWFLYLRDSSTAAGLWRSAQLGASTSQAQASSLAGMGLYAALGLLNQKAGLATKNSNYPVTAADRATTLVNTGGAIAMTFDASSVLANGWFAFFRNGGTGNLTLTAAGGDTIDGAATKVLGIGESAIIVADGGTGLSSIGYGRQLTTAISAVIVNVAGAAGDVALSASEVMAQVQTFTGALTGNRTVTYGAGTIGYWFVYNNTSGAFTLKARVSAGDPGATIAQGSYSILRSDGTTMSIAFTATSGTVTNVATTARLTGGPITSTGTLDLANSGVVAGTYGSAAQSLTAAVDQWGRLTSLAVNTIAAAWGAITGIPAAISAIAALTPAADRLAYFTGASTAALATLTAYGRSLIAAVDAAAARVLITVLTTNGDLWTRTAGVDARLAVGAANTFLAGGTLPAYRALAAADLVAGSIFPRNYLSGLGMSTAGGSGTMSIAAGVAADSTNVSMMNIGAFTKTTSNWALGTAAGGLDTGVIANDTWYTWFEIQRPDTGVVDLTFSLDPTTPALPGSYTLYRRIGAMKTDGSGHWIAFTQNGDVFRWLTPTLDASAVALTATYVDVTVTVPPGVQVEGWGRNNQGSGHDLHVRPKGTLDAAPSATASPLSDILGTATGTLVAGYWRCMTDTSAKIQWAADVVAAAESYLTTEGWIDRRGRDG